MDQFTFPVLDREMLLNYCQLEITGTGTIGTLLIPSLLMPVKGK